MNKLMVVLVAACAANAFAMPTKDELKKAQPLVAELMAPKTAEFKDAGAKDKAAAAAKVGDASVEFAKAAETEAAKFLFLKGAVSYYARGEQYDKAADVMATLQREVKDIPPAVIAEIAGKATGKISETKAPRLYAIYNSAKLQVKAGEEAKSLAAKLKKAQSDVLQRRYAEALAVSGNWKAAYAEFAKVSNPQLKAMAAAEAAGKAKNAEAGEFWWDYKPLMEEADDFFKAHAATFYSKALVAGEITGLKKNLVEQRVKGILGDVAPAAAKPAAAETKPAVAAAKPAQKPAATTKAPKASNVKWTYEIVDGAVVLGAKDKTAVPQDTVGELTIPATIDGKPVRGIGKRAFVECKKLTSVTIPEGVTYLDSGTFLGCWGLKSVTLPTSLKVLGDGVFCWCLALDSVNLPEGVSNIGPNTFQRCPIKSITIPASVSEISYKAFWMCGELTSVTMLGKRPKSYSNSFCDCGKLTTIHVPANEKSWEGKTEWCGVKLVFDAK